MAYICGMIAQTILISDKKLVKEDVGAPTTPKSEWKNGGTSCVANPVGLSDFGDLMCC